MPRGVATLEHVGAKTVTGQLDCIVGITIRNSAQQGYRAQVHAPLVTSSHSEFWRDIPKIIRSTYLLIYNLGNYS